MKLKNLCLIAVFLMLQLSFCYAGSNIVTFKGADITLPVYKGFKFITKEDKAHFEKFKEVIPPKCTLLGVYLSENELQANVPYFSQYILVFLNKKSYQLSNDNEWIQYRNNLVKEYGEKLLGQSLQIVKNDEGTGVVYQGLDLKVSKVEGQKIPFEIISHRSNAVSILESVSYKKMQDALSTVFVSEVSTLYLKGMIIHIDVNRILKSENDIAWVKYLSDTSMDAMLQLNSNKDFKKSKKIIKLPQYIDPWLYIFHFFASILAMIVVFGILSVTRKIYKGIFKIKEVQKEDDIFPRSFSEKYISFNGELNQTDFISGILLLFAVLCSFGMLIFFVNFMYLFTLFFAPGSFHILPPESSVTLLTTFLVGLLAIFFLYFFFILCVKRLKNTRLPAKLAFILLIPYLQIILIAILIFYSRSKMKRKNR